MRIAGKSLDGDCVDLTLAELESLSSALLQDCQFPLSLDPSKEPLTQMHTGCDTVFLVRAAWLGGGKHPFLYDDLLYVVWSQRKRKRKEMGNRR